MTPEEFAAIPAGNLLIKVLSCRNGPITVIRAHMDHESGGLVGRTSLTTTQDVFGLWLGVNIPSQGETAKALRRQLQYLAAFQYRIISTDNGSIS